MTGARLAQTGATVGFKVRVLRQCASCASPLRDWQLEWRNGPGPPNRRKRRTKWTPTQRRPEPPEEHPDERNSLRLV